ncbi:motility associated factor glycosyltransferase family protein [Marinomonas algicola]|uniref:motility associated factor glycosyltransferase family protein n=1 Tax=Marinomonas algicola TaxID=2773454 RepID=UPI0017498BB0|nr:6-hydroxymethylpterin diphosphokinase MptE-like protein [Marinomonas algicola]
MNNDIEKKISEAERSVQKLAELKEQAIVLDESLNECFKKNKEAFEKYMPHILSDFKDFEFNQNLFFISKSGNLNILHTSENAPLYGDDPVKDSKKQVEFFLSHPTFTKIVYGLEKNPRDQIQTEYLNKAIQVSLDARDNLTLLTNVPEFVPSLMVFGIGLGYHLDELISKINSNHYFLYEPDPLLFFASLFIFDWEKLFLKVDKNKSTLNINVGSDPLDYPRDYISQVDVNGRYSASKTFLYLHYKSKKLDVAMEEMHKNYNQQIGGWGFFDDGVFSIGHGYTNLKNKTPILKSNKNISPEIKRKIENLPVFIIGNGPSLDNCIDVIKENRDKVILMSCGTTITTLYRYGIKPDIQLDVERTKHSADKFKFLPADYLKDILALSVNVMHPDYFSYFEKTGYGLKTGEAMTSAFQEKLDRDSVYQALQACNPLVGNLGLSYAYYFGFKNVYLMGIDGGYVKGGLHHSKHSVYYSKDSDEVEAIQNYTTASGVTVEGNFGGEVFSSNLMDQSRYMINILMKEIIKDKKAYYYNCSNGVKFDKIKPLPPEDVFLLDPNIHKKETLDYIYNNFFDAPPLDVSEKDFIDLDGFKSVVSSLKDILDVDYTDRRSFSSVSKKQTDFVNSYRAQGKGKTNLYYLLIGSLNSINAILLTVVYQYDDESEVVEYGKKIIEVWVEYLDAMVERYSNVVGWHDTYDWDGMKLFEEPKSSESEEGDKHVH